MSEGSAPRADKVAVVEEVAEKLEGSVAVFVSEYRGMTVSPRYSDTNTASASSSFAVTSSTTATLSARGAEPSDMCFLLSGRLGVLAGRTPPRTGTTRVTRASEGTPRMAERLHYPSPLGDGPSVFGENRICCSGSTAYGIAMGDPPRPGVGVRDAGPPRLR